MPKIPVSIKRPQAELRTVYIGVDPGASGGIAMIKDNGEMFLYAAMPQTERDIAEVFKAVSGSTTIDYKGTIEAVHAMPGQGVTSMFSFGRNYGFLRGCLISHGISFRETTPKEWQRAVGIFAKKGEVKKDHKMRCLAKAQQMFPEVTLWSTPRSKGAQLAVCDAMLIAYYGRLVDLKGGALGQ